MAEFSVLVLVHGRTEHLRRLLAGVDASALRPVEVVIVYMNEPSPPLMQSVVPLRIVHISSGESYPGLPLARARNAAAAAAQTSNLVFLDVDAIPSAHLFATFMHVLTQERVLAMAEPRYLKKVLDATRAVDDEALFAASVCHHAREGLPKESSMSDHAMFWSLGFAIHASVYADAGGFDEGYIGYGGEDTDFAFRVRELGVPVRFVDAPVFHQHHGVYTPPLNHFREIVDNARLFHARWGVWPMEGWLKAFAYRGLIAWAPSQCSLIVQRMPTPQEVESARNCAAY